MNDQLAAHLEFFAELGVEGLRRESAWRTRATPDATPAAMAGPALAPVPPPIEPVPAALGTRGAGGELLLELKAEIGPDCTRCKLHTLGRKQVVFGVGSPTADLMFVGEAPGADEDAQGEPFVGKAGQLLTKIIEAIGLRREDVYIANVIKCRPPGNRNPEPDEVAECEPFLFRQIDAVRPKVIVALGKFAAQCLLKTDDADHAAAGPRGALSRSRADPDLSPGLPAA